MSKLEVEFQFEIGDFVYFKNSSHTLTNTPIAFMVVGRMAEQCPGGLQLHYRLSGYESAHFTHEIELTRDMPPYRLANPERLAEQQAIRNAQREADEVHWNMAVKATERKHTE